MPAAIAFQCEHDWPRVRAACHRLAVEARERVATLTGLPQIAPDSPDWWQQLCSIPLPAVEPQRLKERLWDEFGVEVPIVSWGGRLFVRVSIQAYNRREDVDRLVDALARLLPGE